MDQHAPELPCNAERMVAGGAALCRADDGRIVFVHGALPGEHVIARTQRVVNGALHADCERVLRRSPERRDAPCAAVARGCGGCDWQHIDPAAQRAFRADIVRDTLRRIAGVGDITVETASPTRQQRYRSWLRLGVIDGVPGHRLRRSHQIDDWSGCLVADERLEHIVATSRFPDADEVTIRVGVQSGESLAYAAPTARGAVVPDGVRVVGADELDAGKRAWIHDEFCGRRWRISARSFQQPGPFAAEALVRTVAEVCRARDVAARSCVDAYGGIGLFAGALAAEGVATDATWHVVESSPDAAADARVNLRGSGAVVHNVGLEHWRTRPADLVVADPPRSGCGPRGIGRIVATGASQVVVVSCDAAALARDAKLLSDRGYRIGACVVVDTFAHTSHVETVTRFDRE